MLHQGTTIVELLVSTIIFVIIIAAFLGLFSSAFHYQEQSLYLAEFLNHTSYVSDYVSRALRMAQKDLAGDCITAKMNFENPLGDTTKIRFLNYNGKCWEFLLENEVIKIKKSLTSQSSGLGVVQPLTPTSLSVTNLVFQVSGDGQTNNLQPKVTFSLAVDLSGVGLGIADVQTTISQRQLDVFY